MTEKYMKKFPDLGYFGRKKFQAIWVLSPVEKAQKMKIMSTLQVTISCVTASKYRVNEIVYR